MKLKYVLLLLSCVPMARAIGPTLPLQFEAEKNAARNWSTAVQVDLTQLAPPSITREIYKSGERMAEEKLPANLPTGKSTKARSVSSCRCAPSR